MPNAIVEAGVVYLGSAQCNLCEAAISSFVVAASVRRKSSGSKVSRTERAVLGAGSSAI